VLCVDILADELAATVVSLRSYGYRAIGAKADISTLQGNELAVATAVREYGGGPHKWFWVLGGSQADMLSASKGVLESIETSNSLQGMRSNWRTHGSLVD
jgi:hypothetical protein